MDGSSGRVDKRSISENPGIALLSCELCTKRKIRCDKRQPCSACMKAGKECTPVLRARFPRGRRGGRKEATTELRDRVKRLESLVLSLSSNDSRPISQERSTPSSIENTNARADLTPDTHPVTSQDDFLSGNSIPLPSTDISRLLGSTVWTQLSDELSGLRSVLETNDDDDDEVDSSSTNLSDSRDEIVISTNSPFYFDTHKESIADTLPSQAVSKVLSIYRTSVDAVSKCTHYPTLQSSIETGSLYLGYPTRSFAFKALKSAVFYVTLCSMTDEQSLENFGEEKEKLRELWRPETEHWLRAADMTRNHNIVIIQALILYVGAIRTHDNGPRAWTLMGMVVRIAHALQLNREESYSSLTFFQAQIHRRAWFCLLGLDFQASFDRGSDPAIPANSYNTKFPFNLNDSDFGPESQMMWSERSDHTDATFLVVASHAQHLLRQLSFVPAGDLDDAPITIHHSWQARQEAVTRLQEQLDQKYLRKCDLSVPIQYATHYLGKVMLSHLQLYVVRPFQRHPAMRPPSPEAANVLLRATEALGLNQMFSDSTTRPWHWMFEGWVDWHPLAVLLTELCSPQHDQQLVQRAWQVADVAFDRIALSVAEGTRGMLWKPLKKLMRIAQRKRALDQPLPLVVPASGWANDDAASMLLEQSHLSTTMTGLDMSTAAGFDFAMGQMDDSWMNWQGFVHDFTQNSYTGWTTDIMLFQPAAALDEWPAL